ncbi:MAG TPA: N-acetyl-1-D-myo-inositol-2-amino-2-deoxy-alpha-D-glucopyranoside deacetylase [Chloroflexota bacterium]|nr:N-acetyl-1-D-myo-inositol-2-amino-2-deoxy-alpha-D-glucopyranoside deacetylase [Chloroflexota bacterium]
MADAALTLMAVHAHPDDEAIGTGGTLARYAAEGVRTVLVTCTDGAVGEIVDPTVATPETLAAVRADELRTASELLGVSALHCLGYRDSGMMGTPENDDPRSFWRADLDEATGRLVALIRQERPQVIVTYDENGFYGHPDHIQTNRVSVAAFHAAGDPARYPEQGLAPWAPSKLYYAAVPISRLREFGRRLRELDIEAPFGENADEPEFGTPDERIVATIDARPYARVKREALAVHRSQVGPETFFLLLPPPVWEETMGTEYFERPISTVPAPAHEDDLFAGLRG